MFSTRCIDNQNIQLVFHSPLYKPLSLSVTRKTILTVVLFHSIIGALLLYSIFTLTYDYLYSYFFDL